MSRSKLSIGRLKKFNYNGTVEKDVDLSSYTTFRCGGTAKYLVKINTIENFLHVMIYLKKLGIQWFVIGAGSNLLVSDNGYAGVVIKLGGDFARIEERDDNVLECGAGCSIASVLAYAKNSNLSGLEDSCGIPATIGGAVFMNASAYNFEMAKIVDYVIAFKNGKIAYLTNKECQFCYRHSVFQNDDSIILRVGLKLNSLPKIEIEGRIKEVLLKRRSTQPLEFPSAGCVFRRIDGINVSKALDDCGLKGLTFGGAKVSEKHANFIINYHNATAQEIYELIDVIKKRFKDKTGLDLSTEIKFLGDFDEITR